jgi:hypothetical protein
MLRVLAICLLVLLPTLPAAAGPRKPAEKKAGRVLSQAEIDRMLGVAPQQEAEEVLKREAKFQRRWAAGEAERYAAQARGDFFGGRGRGSDLARFATVLEELDPRGVLVVGVRRGMSDDDAKVVVGLEWHYQPFQVRIQLAQSLQSGWAAIHSPRDPDKALISLVDQRGNSIGGSSSIFGGSVVHVDR